MFEASIIMRWLRSWSAVACRPKSFSDAICPFLPVAAAPSRVAGAGRAENHKLSCNGRAKSHFALFFQRLTGKRGAGPGDRASARQKIDAAVADAGKSAAKRSEDNQAEFPSIMRIS